MNQNTVQLFSFWFFQAEKASFYLLFHPGYLFQVPPPVPLDLKHLFHPKEPNTHVCIITFTTSILGKVVVNPPFAQGLRPHQAGLADQTFLSLQDPPKDRFRVW